MTGEATETENCTEVGGQVDPLVMPEFSQGVCSDGAAILMNGKPLTIDEILSRLRKGATAERIVGEVWDMFYGQNMEVANWHLNGDLEPIDSFFDENHWSLDEA